MRWCVRTTKTQLRALTILLSILNASSAICCWVNSGTYVIVICILIQQKNGVYNQTLIPPNKYPNKYPNKFVICSTQRIL